jgi:hypothetical protein
MSAEWDHPIVVQGEWQVKNLGARRHKRVRQTGKLYRELSLMFAADVKSGTKKAALPLPASGPQARRGSAALDAAP